MPATAPQMNEHLAQFYGTKQASAVTDEEAEKQASVELFLKVASDQNIDLNSMSDADVQALYGEFKIASEEEPPKEEKDEEEEKKEKEEKHAAAAAEWAEKQAMAADIQKADYLGRVMAHSFEQERGYIKEAGGVDREAVLRASALARNSHVRRAVGQARQLGGKAVDAVGGAAGRAADKAGKGFEHLGKKITEKATGVGTHNMKPSHAKAVGGAAVAGGAAAAAGGAAAAHHHSKEASMLDELGAERAVEMVVQDGTFDAEEASRKVAAVLELGLLGESEKVASAPNYQVGVDIRALEILEAAGYPVTWNDPAA